MIQDHDRSFWIGASDTSYVMGNWKTATFSKWWLKKLGLEKENYETKAMKVGTVFEHKILDTLSRVREKDKQIIIPELGLRVNYDGTGKDYICEVKTSRNEFKLSKAYKLQAQVEMFAWKYKYGVLPELEIAAYRVDENDYKNYFTPIDVNRLSLYPVEYDEKVIEEYLEKLGELHKHIVEGTKP